MSYSMSAPLDVKLMNVTATVMFTGFAGIGELVGGAPSCVLDCTHRGRGRAGA